MSGPRPESLTWNRSPPSLGTNKPSHFSEGHQTKHGLVWTNNALPREYDNYFMYLNIGLDKIIYTCTVNVLVCPYQRIKTTLCLQTGSSHSIYPVSRKQSCSEILFFKTYFQFMCMVLSTKVCAPCVCLMPQRPEKSARPPGTGVRWL